jgi:hypothetical protein
MLTQNYPAISSAIRIDNTLLCFGIYLGDEYIGLVVSFSAAGGCSICVGSTSPFETSISGVVVSVLVVS